MAKADEDLAAAIFIGSIAIGIGFGSIADGLKCNDQISIGIGLISGVIAFIVICKLIKVKPPTS
jgi:hypothetical protein